MAGRKTTWEPGVTEKAWYYLRNFEEFGHPIPSIVGLCQVIERPRRTVYLWKEDPDKGIDDVLDAIVETQELVTLNKALVGEYNSNIAKLLLGKHGYHEKHDLQSPDGSLTPQPTVIEIVGASED